MKKHFNTAGPCKPDWHYMLPPERRAGEIQSLIEAGQYFVLHAPRQTGKTTVVLALCNSLNASGDYTALYVDVETAEVAGGDVERGMRTIMDAIELQAEIYLREIERPPVPDELGNPNAVLQRTLTAWAQSNPKPIVLFIDEIDALQDETLLSVLRQLRGGYTGRPGLFPHSLALIGLRDVRDYKARIRPDSNSLGTASPFNIKVESLTLRNFTRDEATELYLQHTQETGQKFAEDALDLAFELTQGQPWLVNALARQLVQKVVPDPPETIRAEHVREAKEILIERRDCHLDSLVDKLREQRVKRIIEPILVGKTMPMDVLNDDLSYVRDLGLVASTGPAQIANPIYAEVIPRCLSQVMQANIANEPAWYIREDGSLDVPALLRAFQAFFRQHSEAWLARFEFQEAGPHLMLMAFLQRIVNAGGTIEREFAIGAGRADVLIRWGADMHAIELKIRYGDITEQEGIEQLSNYLDRLGLRGGYLFIFDRRKGAGWDERIYDRIIEHGSKQIHVFGA